MPVNGDQSEVEQQHEDQKPTTLVGHLTRAETEDEPTQRENSNTNMMPRL